jgi:hypothetical protein
MDTTDFQTISTDPNSWLSHSRNQRMIAQTLMSAYLPKVAEAGLAIRAGSNKMELLDDAIYYLRAAHMHYGLSLETALKGVMIQKWPEKIEFDITHDDIRISKIGVNISKTHDLHLLAKETGLFTRPTDASEWPDEKYFKAALLHLSDMVKWSARYPVPISLKKKYNYDEQVPFMIYGHYLEDVIDPVLDYILVQSTQP